MFESTPIVTIQLIVIFVVCWKLFENDPLRWLYGTQPDSILARGDIIIPTEGFYYTPLKYTRRIMYTRLLSMVYLIGTVVYQFTIIDPNTTYQTFSNWIYMTNVLYFVSVTVCTYLILKGYHSLQPLVSIIAVLFAITLCMSLVWLVVFYAGILPFYTSIQNYQTFTAINHHTVGPILILNDFVWNRMIIRRSYVIFLVVWIYIYILTIWCTFHVTNSWTYSLMTMDWYALMTYPVGMSLPLTVYSVLVFVSHYKDDWYIE